MRDSTHGTGPIAREFDEAVPTLQPLEKTGAQEAIRSEPSTRQDESGAVTLAQGPLGERPRVDTPSPSVPLDVADKQSGGFSTPTPLPAPMPAGPDEFGGSPPPTRLARPSPSDAVTTGTPSFANDSNEPAFASAGPAPAFAEAFRSSTSRVRRPRRRRRHRGRCRPIRSGDSDGAIEYFVEWSMEQSTAPKPKAAEGATSPTSHMLTPRAEKRRSMRRRHLLSGIAIGIFLGLPLGGAIVWFLRPLPPPIIVEKMPGLARRGRSRRSKRRPPLVADSAVVAKVEPPADLSVPEKLVQPVAKHKKGELAIKTNPSGATVSIDGEAQDGKTPLTVTLSAGTHEVSIVRERYATVTQSVDVPGKIDLVLKRPTATLHVDSEPAGGEVIVGGKPRGKTPVDVTLDAFQHYDVQVMLPAPSRGKVSLKPPQTDVTAKLSVVHNP